MPRLKSLAAIAARIRLKRPIKHASHVRYENDTLLVRAELEDGTVGWGEGLPREYVTGETIGSCFETLAEADLQPLQLRFESLSEAGEIWQACRFPRPPADQRDCFGNTVRCAVETAFLDAVTRQFGLPFSAIGTLVPEAATLAQNLATVRYSAVITSVKPWKERAMSLAFHLYGFDRFKVKVGVAGQNEPASLRRIRSMIGRADLRADANEGWAASDVEARIAALVPYHISAIEQPVPHRAVKELRPIRRNRPVPIMLDESLCSLGDAERAITDEYCDLFNLRLSKCGGYLNCLRLASLAQRAELGYQLGCMVGETGILTAAGRHFAASVRGIRYLEGGFDRYLVRTPLSREDLTFGRGGWAKSLGGSGLGITVSDGEVAEVTVRRVELLRGGSPSVSGKGTGIV